MKRVLLLLLIAVVAGAFWFWRNQDRFFPKPVAQEVAPQRWQVSGVTTSNATDATNATSLALNATNATNATLDENATANATVAEDSIVGHGFVKDLGRYMVSVYHPAQTKRNPSDQARFDLNLKSLNIRYGVDFPGLYVNPTDTLKSRKTVFNHVFTPSVLEFLHTVYTPLFLDNIESALLGSPRVQTSGQRAEISETQRREMLTMLAAKLRAVGKTVGALARTASARELVGKYLADMEKVNEAHITFWNLQSENASASAVDAAGIQIKAAIQTREMSRQRLLQTIVSTANPQGLDASELIYLAQWVYRRGLENPDMLARVATAGDLGVKTAAALEERARQPRPAPTVASVNASEENDGLDAENDTEGE